MQQAHGLDAFGAQHAVVMGPNMSKSLFLIFMMTSIIQHAYSESFNTGDYEAYEPREFEGNLDSGLWGKYNLKSYSYLFKGTWTNIPLTRVYVVNGDVVYFELIASYSLNNPKLADFHTIDYLLDEISEYYRNRPQYFMVSYGALGQPSQFKVRTSLTLHQEYGFDILEVVPLARKTP